ncbi:MAG: HPr family phosphocarrier protein [Spirochaetaceae bacterium]|jgi:phosphocarrier protein|nr:HPr family phosphocarrier protein [Spirochaetaceae bacterium]
MVEKTIIVQNRAGIHARPAALIAQTANKFDSDIRIINAALKLAVNAKSIMGVITLAAGYNITLTVTAEGADESQAVEAIIHLFEIKFDED